MQVLDARFFDAHNHISWIKNQSKFANNCVEHNITGFVQSVTPSEYKTIIDSKTYDKFYVGLGFHPWNVTEDNDSAVDEFIDLAAKTRYIGEIGLDFLPKHKYFECNQIAVFKKICSNIQANSVISLHAEKSGHEMMDILESTGRTKDSSLILHWFLGSSDELDRARTLGFYFSCGSGMLSTKRGREYVRQIPVNKLLLESDLPYGENSTLPFDSYLKKLNDAVETIAELKKKQVDEMSKILLDNANEAFK